MDSVCSDVTLQHMQVSTDYQGYFFQYCGVPYINVDIYIPLSAPVCQPYQLSMPYHGKQAERVLLSLSFQNLRIYASFCIAFLIALNRHSPCDVDVP